MTYTKPRRIRISTPGKVIFHVLMLLVVIAQGLSSTLGAVSHFDLGRPDIAEDELQAQVKSIRRRLRSGEASFESMITPEAPFLTNVFYGYALTNMAMRIGTTKEQRKAAAAEIEAMVKSLVAYKERSLFSYAKSGPPGGIIYAGNLNRLRAAYILLGGSDATIVSDFHASSKQIANAFNSSDPPFPESFGGLTWPVDGVCAIDSLRLHDVIFGTNFYEPVNQRWCGWLKNHIDPQTGLMIAQAGADAKAPPVVDGTRGCAMSWTLAFLPIFDEAFDMQQYEIFRKQWFVHFWGMLGIREWFNGVERPTQFIAGPTVAGMGAAASGLGIAATRVNGDLPSWHRLLRSLEIFGIPLRTVYGEKSYFLGLSLLCDSIALWGKTATNWDAPEASGPDPYAADAARADHFWLTILINALLYSALAGLLIWRAVTLGRSPDVIRPKFTKLMLGMCILQVALGLLWLFTPILSWLQILPILVFADLIEEMMIRPAVVRDVLGM